MPAASPRASAPGAPAAASDARRTTPPLGRPTGNPARAQQYARKGEAAWRAGDLAAAVFNLRLAMAADPTSQSIRAALTQVEAEAKADGKPPGG